MTNKKFLDQDGLAYFYTLLNNKFVSTETDPVFTALKSNIVASVELNPSQTKSYSDGYKHITLTETDPTVPAWAKAATKPTYTVSEISGAASTTYVGTAIDNALANVTSISYSIVTELPTTGQAGVIYLKSNAAGGTGDSYDEYIWLAASSKYELVGHKILDLSNYWNSTSLVAMTNSEIDTAISGS